MTGAPPVLPRLRFTDATGKPLALGTLTTYLAGTTTLVPTYQDQALTVPNPTTIPLNANGEATVWLDPSQQYKFLAKDPLGVTMPGWPVDNIAGASTQAPIDVVSVKNKGAKGDFVTDDAAAFQAAINEAQTSNVPLYIPPGNYMIGTALNVTGNLTMYGAGMTSSALRAMTNTQNVISIVSTNGLTTFRDFMIVGKTTATAGALVSLNGGPVGPSNINLFASFDGVRFQDGWNQLFTVTAGSWTVNKCLFVSPNNTGCVIQNQVNLDGGDMGIVNSTFLGKSVGTAVLQFSAGGLRFVGNKVIAWANGYTLDMAAGVSTADLFIIGNSFESFTDAAIVLTRDVGNSFVAAHIIGNEIAGTPTGIRIVGDSGPWLQHLAVTGNAILIDVAAGTCMSVQGTNNFVIADNFFNSSGTATGLVLGTVISHGIIHDNTFTNLAASITGAANGTNMRIHDNDGYNPVGGANLSPTASPWTFTNGPTPATLYVAAVTGITNIAINGVSVLPTAMGANVNFAVPLGANEAAVITYSGTLTAKKMVH